MDVGEVCEDEGFVVGGDEEGVGDVLAGYEGGVLRWWGVMVEG